MNYKKNSDYVSFLQNMYDELSVKFSNETEDYILECDKVLKNERVDSRRRELKKEEYRMIHNRLLPQPVVGDLVNGKIFLCLLNPGFDNQNYNDETEIKDELLNQFMQESPSMFWLKSDYYIKKVDGSRWWRSKFDQANKRNSLINCIRIAYENNGIKITDECIFSMLSRIVVDLELIPYHSKRAPKAFEDLESVKRIKTFVFEELLPKAKENNQIVCFLRSLKAWGINQDLEKKYDGVMFCNHRSPQSITFNPNIKYGLGEFIMNYLGKITGNFKKTIS